MCNELGKYSIVGKISAMKAEKHGVFIQLAGNHEHTIKSNNKDGFLNVWLPLDVELNKATEVLTMKPGEWVKVEDRLLPFLQFVFRLNAEAKITICSNDFCVVSVQLGVDPT